MPIYSISAPDGKTYQIEGPAGASQEQVQAEVLRQNPNAGSPSTEITAENIKQGLLGAVPSALMGAAKPFLGLNQAAWQLAGKVAPSVANMGDWPIEAINKKQAELNKQAGPIVSKFTTFLKDSGKYSSKNSLAAIGFSITFFIRAS